MKSLPRSFIRLTVENWALRRIGSLRGSGKVFSTSLEPWFFSKAQRLSTSGSNQSSYLSPQRLPECKMRGSRNLIREHFLQVMLEDVSPYKGITTYLVVEVAARLYVVSAMLLPKGATRFEQLTARGSLRSCRRLLRFRQSPKPANTSLSSRSRYSHGLPTYMSLWS